MRQTGEETREFGIVGCLLSAIILARAAVSSLAQGAESDSGDVTSQKVEGGPARGGGVPEGPRSVPEELKPGDGLVSPALAAPSQGIGAAAGGWFSKHLYAIAGLADANSDPASPNFDVFKNWETFQHFEIGYSSSKKRWFPDNLHVTFWHADEREAAGVPEDWGVSASYSWWFRKTWAPFLRAGWSQGRATLYEASIGTEFGYLTLQQDVFGLAVNRARPGGGGDLSDQWTAEVFYKYQVTETFALTPDIQAVLDPALNPDQEAIGFFGLRARLAIRTIPLSAQLQPVLRRAQAISPTGNDCVIHKCQSGSRNWRTQFDRLIRRSGQELWSMLFQNLRSGREVELSEACP
jgi:hypothetical protein